MIETKLKTGNIEWKCTCENGSWTYKIEKTTIEKGKAKYKERPRFKVLEEIDQQALSFAKQYHKSISFEVKKAIGRNL